MQPVPEINLPEINLPESNATGYLDRAWRHGLLAGQRRQNRIPTLLLLLPAFIYVLLSETINGYRIIGPDRLMDPDSYMRIVRIRDGLQAGWFTHVVANDNAGKGTVVYWSHLLDAVVLTLRMPLRLVWSDPSALFEAAAVTGPLFAMLLAVVVVWATAPLMGSDRAWLWIGPFAAVLSPALFSYGLLGYVHYHLPLVVLAVAAAGCAGRAAEGRTAAGCWCGIWSAVGVWLSPEALPYVLMAMSAIGVAWCLRPASVAGAIRSCGTAFAAAVVAAVLIDPPYGGFLSVEIDCISIVYAVLAVLLCGAAWALASLGLHVASVWRRIVCALLTGLIVVGIWLWLYPRVLRGLGGLVPPEDARAFFGTIAEMRPIGHDLRSMSLLLTGIFAIGAALGLAWKRRNALWLYAAGCGIVVVTLAAMYVRFLGYSEAIGVLMLLAMLGASGSWPQARGTQALLRAGVTAAFLFGPAAVAVLGGKVEPDDARAQCNVTAMVPELRHESNAIVLTEISDTPEILWRTPVRTVGSLYHRSIGAFIRARNAWRTAPSDGVPDAVLATGAADILACDLNHRTALVSDLPPVTLQDRLAHHEVPSWLYEVGHAGGYHLYRIVSDAAGVRSGAGSVPQPVR
jgi:hypothetical protein